MSVFSLPTCRICCKLKCLGLKRLYTQCLLSYKILSLVCSSSLLFYVFLWFFMRTRKPMIFQTYLCVWDHVLITIVNSLILLSMSWKNEWRYWEVLFYLLSISTTKWYCWKYLIQISSPNSVDPNQLWSLSHETSNRWQSL